MPAPPEVRLELRVVHDNLQNSEGGEIAFARVLEMVGETTYSIAGIVPDRPRHSSPCEAATARMHECSGTQREPNAVLPRDAEDRESIPPGRHAGVPGLPCQSSLDHWVAPRAEDLTCGRCEGQFLFSFDPFAPPTPPPWASAGGPNLQILTFFRGFNI